MAKRMAVNKPAYRQDSLLSRIFEQVESGSEELRLVLVEIHRLKSLGVEVTQPVADRIIEKVKLRLRPVPPRPPARPPKPRSPRGRFSDIEQTGAVVYYVRIGNRVKIGTSTNLRDRLQAINPEELLALELGGHNVESRRHRQFASLRTHGEWFRYEGPLAEHIERLRQ